MLNVRWLGTVPYSEALDLQHAIHAHGRAAGDHLLLLEHPPTFTLGVRADPAHVLDAHGAEVVRSDRGGDVTWHGPGQLVGYPILTLPPKRGRTGPPDSAAHVATIEQVLIDALADVGLPGCGRLDGYPGVWVDPWGPSPRKIAAIGVRVTRGRSMHGFALNVSPDMAWFDRLVPCGITEYGVTSLSDEGVSVSVREVVDAVIARATTWWGAAGAARADVAWRHTPDDLSPFSRGAGPGRAVGRLAAAGVTEGLTIGTRKPEWLRPKVHHGPEVLRLKRQMRDEGLVTVCEEAGCPNLSECWADGTATFMINGERCTRACGFCLVDTSKPLPLDGDEPRRVAASVAALGLQHAVVTAVARDDLADGGAVGFAATIEAIHATVPGCAVEVLIADCKGDAAALDSIFATRPEVLNHNLETVARLQRAVRPSAGYARSLAVLARAKAAGLVTKSGLIVGLGETDDEVGEALADLAAVGCDIVTIGQYLRPTSNHLPVARWVEPAQFGAWAALGESLGIGHVEASPLTRSSYHARAAAGRVSGVFSGASGPESVR